MLVVRYRRTFSLKVDPTRLSPTTDLRNVTSQKNEGLRSWVVTNTEEIVFRTKRDDGVMFMFPENCFKTKL